MHRIETDGATVDNQFTDGNPAAGQQGTVMDAAWLNDLQENVAQAIEGAGIGLVKGNGGQLLAAIQALVGIAASAVIRSINLAAKGHVEFANGLLINWGSDQNGDNTGGQAVDFDKPFAAAPLVSYATNTSGGPPVAFHGTGGGYANGMTVWSSTGPGAVAAGAGTSFHWLAIGHA